MTEEKTIKKCPNCGNELVDNPKFCPHCGQENKEIELKFTHFFHDFLSSNFNLDSKIFLTLKLLIFYPGKLSKEYLAGKRVKYVTPVRLYLIISLVYFTVLSFTNAGVKFKKTENDKERVVFGVDEKDSVSVDKSVNRLFTVDTTLNSDTTTKSTFEKFLVSKLKLMQTKQGRKEFNAKLRSYISMGMFILIPLTALILNLLFYKNSFYIQHLVFIIHLQSLMFLVFTLFNLLGLISGWSIFEVMNTLLFLFLLLVWIKKFYVIKWGKAIWKSLLFIAMFGILFFLFLAVVAGASFYNM